MKAKRWPGHNKSYRKPDKGRPHKRKGCGKVCFPHLAAARHAISEIVRLGVELNGHKGVFEGYYCRSCRAYHIGHDKLKHVAG